ncbi:hypothetical protein LLG07_04330 [bacterium]|nr:hypothetical protein [bacterium]
MHEAKNLDLFLKEMTRILKPGGRIAIIDWNKADSEFGPPKNHKNSLFDPPGINKISARVLT